jgi:transposase InsO family protein
MAEAAAPAAPDAALAAAAHQQRLQALLAAAGTATSAVHRRGSTWQQPRRQLEQAVRQHAVAFRQWLAARGLSRSASAACLGIAVRTLRDWEDASATVSLALALRGRPVLHSQRAQRTEVLGLLDSVGPGVGLAVLQGQFPALLRAELADLLQRYRRVWRHQHQQPLHVLHWQRPGAVWAIDYAEPPLPLEEGFTDLLAVRDLASGFQLLWLPVAAATAATTVDALLWLFAIYGAPLVLKMDNGSPFVAAATQTLLAQFQVVPLYSPPRLPQYNGAIEAGIGALKTRTHAQAARGGHPGQWTLADTEAARQLANTLGRPQGAQAPTPAQRWGGRQVLTIAERNAFAATLAQLQEEAARPGLAGAADPPVPEGTSPAAAAAGALPGAHREEEPARPASAEAANPALLAAPSVSAGALTVAAACPPAAEPAPTADPAGSGEPGLERTAARTAAPPRESPSKDRRSARDDPGREASRPSPERAAEQRRAISRALVAHG